MGNAEVKQSWVEMVDSAMYRVFLSRQAQINAGIMTAKEADEIIVATSKKYMDRYANMDEDKIHAIMVRDLLGCLISQLDDLDVEFEEEELE